MPEQRKTLHNTVLDTALPYVTFDNPLSEGWAIEDGQNVLTSQKGFCERFPGFGQTVESVASTFTNCRRIFYWRKWSSTFCVMFNDITATDSKVYKYEIGVDTSAVLIHTASGTTEPFDFVVANNWCFFGNGTTRANQRKWRSGSSSYLWGIDTPTVTPVATVIGAGNTGVLAPTAAAGTNWTNPTFALASDGSYAVYNNTAQNYLSLTGLGASIPNGATIAGIIVAVEGNGTSATAADRLIHVGLTTDGTTLAGVLKSTTLNQTTDTTISLGTNTDLWGATLTEALVEGSTFGVLIRDADTTGAALNIDYVTVTVYYSSTSTLDASVGYSYVYTYGSSLTDHQSSPSDSATCTGVFTDSQVSVSVTASTDPQVDRIHVYRTTDGGSEDSPELMRELPASPYTNATTTVTDTTDDTDLLDSFSPARLQNDPPVASKGFVYSKSFKRVIGFYNNKVIYSGYEEIGTGVPEEAFPGGLDGNTEQFDHEVTALADADGGVVIFTPRVMYGIEGDSLDTLRRYKVLDARGTRSRTSVGSLGGDVFWLDTSGTVWVSSLGEIGLPIRDQLSGIDHTKAYLVPFISDNYHWLVLGLGDQGRLLVYDLDKRQWMPPRVISSTIGAVASGETSVGVSVLSVSKDASKTLQMTPGAYLDDGQTYAAHISLSLTRIHDEGNPSWRGVVDWVEVERNTVGLDSLGLLVDDDPAIQPHVDMNEVSEANLDIQQGTSLKVTRYVANPEVGRACRRASLRFDWAAANSNFELYQFDLAYHPTI